MASVTCGVAPALALHVDNEAPVERSSSTSSDTATSTTSSSLDSASADACEYVEGGDCRILMRGSHVVAQRRTPDGVWRTISSFRC